MVLLCLSILFMVSSLLRQAPRQNWPSLLLIARPIAGSSRSQCFLLNEKLFHSLMCPLNIPGAASELCSAKRPSASLTWGLCIEPPSPYNFEEINKRSHYSDIEDKVQICVHLCVWECVHASNDRLSHYTQDWSLCLMVLVPGCFLWIPGSPVYF